MEKQTPLFKMNEATYVALIEVLEHLNDGRIFLARSKLEFILGLDEPKEIA